MSIVEFKYNNASTIIQCEENEKMSKICEKFVIKADLDKSNIYFSYDGKSGSQFNQELTFFEIANSIDKERKKMNVLVYDINEVDDEETGNKLIKSKNIICPVCGENIKIKIDNNKIRLYDCKNKHEERNLTLDQFENTQYINLSKIDCKQCNQNNKNDTFNNEFYKCINCKKNLCPLCKSNHDKNHIIINYDLINYICAEHKEKFTKYCNKCKINICPLCENNHLGHEIQEIILLNKEDLTKKLNELRKSIDLFNKDINKIIEILNKTKEFYEKYYEIEKEMINNYDIKNRNFEIIFNLNEITNNDIVKYLNEINNKENLNNKLIKILNKFYNEISLTLKVEKDDIDKDIYFLDNTKGEIRVYNNREKHYHDFLKELNESNTELIINNEKFKYEKFFKPQREGIYIIKLKFNIYIKDCSFMFYECNNIINIDFSLFNTNHINDMNSMFFGCNNLKNIDLSFFNTKNVKNMFSMFRDCKNLTNIDLYSFNTNNVVNMHCMFSGCSNLKNIDLSSFQTKNITQMIGIFHGCNNLKNIDLSSFDTKNITDMIGIFEGCSNLENIDLSSFDLKNISNMEKMFKDCHNLKEIIINKNSYKYIKKEIKSKTIEIKKI